MFTDSGHSRRHEVRESRINGSPSWLLHKLTRESRNTIETTDETEIETKIENVTGTATEATGVTADDQDLLTTGHPDAIMSKIPILPAEITELENAKTDILRDEMTASGTEVTEIPGVATMTDRLGVIVISLMIEEVEVEEAAVVETAIEEAERIATNSPLKLELAAVARPARLQRKESLLQISPIPFLYSIASAG